MFGRVKKVVSSASQDSKKKKSSTEDVSKSVTEVSNHSEIELSASPIDATQVSYPITQLAKSESERHASSEESLESIESLESLETANKGYELTIGSDANTVGSGSPEAPSKLITQSPRVTRKQIYISDFGNVSGESEKNTGNVLSNNQQSPLPKKAKLSKESLKEYNGVSDDDFIIIDDTEGMWGGLVVMTDTSPVTGEKKVNRINVKNVQIVVRESTPSQEKDSSLTSTTTPEQAKQTDVITKVITKPKSSRFKLFCCCEAESSEEEPSVEFSHDNRSVQKC